MTWSSAGSPWRHVGSWQVGQSNQKHVLENTPGFIAEKALICFLCALSDLLLTETFWSLKHLVSMWGWRLHLESGCSGCQQLLQQMEKRQSFCFVFVSFQELELVYPANKHLIGSIQHAVMNNLEYKLWSYKPLHTLYWCRLYCGFNSN